MFNQLSRVTSLIILLLFAFLLFDQIEAKKKKKGTGKSKESEESAYMRQKHEELAKFIKEDEGHLVDPFLGGYNSQRAKMLQVTFHSLEAIQKDINPRWRAQREMVEDMQKMLLTGGVQTNLFKTETSTFVFVVNDVTKLEQAREFFEGLPEVESVEAMGDNPEAEVIYSNDEL